MEEFLCFGQMVPGFNRQNIRMGGNEDIFALHAWRTRVLCRARDLEIGLKFSAEALDAAFLRGLVKLSMDEDGPLHAVKKLHAIGLPVIIEPHLPGTHLDGAALRLPADGRPVIGLTLRFDRLDHFWFCLLHELGHVVKHILPGKAEEIFDHLEGGKIDATEKEADDFALWTLIPKSDWERIWEAKAFDAASIRREAKRLRVGPSIIAGRIRRETKNYKVLNPLIGQGKVRRLFGIEESRKP
jgi:HTH-type transcriptional regulator/antitoxin HigA